MLDHKMAIEDPIISPNRKVTSAANPPKQAILAAPQTIFFLDIQANVPPVGGQLGNPLEFISHPD